jgi:hypothetical protein
MVQRDIAGEYYEGAGRFPIPGMVAELHEPSESRCASLRIMPVLRAFYDNCALYYVTVQ